MNFEEFITKLRKHVRTSYQQIGDTMIAGGIKDMEGYKYLLGQAQALMLIDQEISNLLNPKEDKKDERQDDDTNVIRFGPRDSED